MYPSSSESEDESGGVLWDGISLTVSNSLSFLSGPNAHGRNQVQQRYI